MDETFEVRLTRQADYRFRAEFPGTAMPALEVDEDAPLGAGSGPNPSRLLATAVGDCLAASLLFCLSKSRVEIADLSALVRGQLTRNERGRWRIARLDVELQLDPGGADAQRLAKCLGLFEDFCVVTGSVRAAIPVSVRVVDPAGAVLHVAGADEA